MLNNVFFVCTFFAFFVCFVRIVAIFCECIFFIFCAWRKPGKQPGVRHVRVRQLRTQSGCTLEINTYYRTLIMRQTQL